MSEELNRESLDKPAELIPGLNLVQASDEINESMPKFEVDILGWHGPYDLILQVIDEQGLNLLDLDISALLDHYLRYLEGLNFVDIDEAGEFLVVAATLAQIKSKMLLPPEENEQNQEEEIDPRAELVKYLQEYQKFKEAARLLQERPILGRDVFVKGGREHFEGLELEGRGQLFQLVKGFQKAWVRTETQKTYQIDQEEVSVSERYKEIFHALLEKKELNFDEVLPSEMGRLYLIASFLAVLELVRMKKIRILQNEPGDQMFLTYVEGASEEDVVHSEFDEPESAEPEALPAEEVSA